MLLDAPWAEVSTIVAAVIAVPPLLKFGPNMSGFRDEPEESTQADGPQEWSNECQPNLHEANNAGSKDKSKEMGA